MAIQHNQEHISIAKMIQNPTGKNTAFFASRVRVKAQLDSIFIKNLRRYRREFYAVPYVDDITHNIYFYVSVPSETFSINRVRWDCLIEIIYNKSLSLENRDAKYYTNSPSFIFTYAYVFNQQDLLPQIIKKKMPSQCLTQPPTIKNPVETRGFDKILYQALKYLTVGGCLTDSYIDKFKQRWNILTQNNLLARCADTDTLISVYQNAKRLDALKHNKNKKKITPQQKNAMETGAKMYDKFRKATTPSHVGSIIRKAPRSKITAKKALSKKGYVGRTSKKTAGTSTRKY